MQRVARLGTSLTSQLSCRASSSSTPSRRLYSTSPSNTDSSSEATVEVTPNQPVGTILTREMLEAAEQNVNLEEIIAAVEAQEALENGPGGGDRPLTMEDMYDLESTLEEFKGDDSSSVGHHMLRQRREVLEYFRLIELELPSLHVFRKPFTPPTPSVTPIVARTMTYGGIAHPVTRKAALVVPVAQLPLPTPEAKHKFKVLAGVRWSLDPPKDAGLGAKEVKELAKEEHGYFKISHEALPELAMNLKWCSDTLDTLVAEANDARDTLSDIPLDTRHLTSQASKRRKGQQRRGPNGERVGRATLADFPAEWLPTEKQVQGMRKWLAIQHRRANARGGRSREVPQAL